MIKAKSPIDLHWPTQDPFLFCAHHFDHYPKGSSNLGVDKSQFIGRQMGSDFIEKDGFRLYHGNEVPGFPVHPHRGFETITIVRQGYVDHADSLGAAGRYGEGDVQWMSTGSGVQHSEMFPLLHKDKENTLEIFQIWLNLPAANKMTRPDFKMLWSEDIPRIKEDKINITLISGEYKEHKFYQAPPQSWANDPKHQVNILLVKLEPNGVFTFPKATIKKSRMLYHFVGDDLSINTEVSHGKLCFLIDHEQDLVVTSKSGGEILLLDACPIEEPVVQHGPFVMNTREEIMKTFNDYQATQFGGWSWERTDMVHGAKIERFAKYPNGNITKPKHK